MNACRKWLCNFQKKNRSVEDQILKKLECEQLHKFLLELSKKNSG